MLTKRSSQKKKRNNNKSLYESIINDVSKVVNKHLNEMAISGKNDLNEIINRYPGEKLPDLLLNIMIKEDLSYTDLTSLIKIALKQVKVTISNNKKSSKLKPEALANWLKETVLDAIQSAVDDSGYNACRWEYYDFIMDEDGYANLLQDPLNDYWSDIVEEIDPSGKYDDFDDYFNNQLDNKKQQIINFVNNITCEYFKGDTNASYEYYE